MIREAADLPGTDENRIEVRGTSPHASESRSGPDTGVNHIPWAYAHYPAPVPPMQASAGVKLNKFDSNESLKTFLLKSENHADYFNWSDCDRLFHLKNCLEREAGQIMWNVDLTVSFTELVRILRNRFGRKISC